MIGIDTNILLRIFITEGGSDEARARRFLAARAGKGSFYVPIVVLVELVWTLCTRYRYRGPEISQVLRTLLGSDQFVMENPRSIEEALSIQDAVGADFADALIAVLCHQAGCKTTATLDRHAAKSICDMELIP